jgi:hypothetical protein
MRWWNSYLLEWAFPSSSPYPHPLLSSYFSFSLFPPLEYYLLLFQDVRGIEWTKILLVGYVSGGGIRPRHETLVRGWFVRGFAGVPGLSDLICSITLVKRPSLHHVCCYQTKLKYIGDERQHRWWARWRLPPVAGHHIFLTPPSHTFHLITLSLLSASLPPSCFSLCFLYTNPLAHPRPVFDLRRSALDLFFCGCVIFLRWLLAIGLMYWFCIVTVLWAWFPSWIHTSIFLVFLHNPWLYSYDLVGMWADRTNYKTSLTDCVQHKGRAVSFRQCYKWIWWEVVVSILNFGFHSALL